MIPRNARALLCFSSILLLGGAALHAAAFGRASAAFASSNLLAFFGNSSRALWLGDSATLAVLGLLCCTIAMRPASASKAVIFLLALIPAATAALLYFFLGAFPAGHLLTLIALAMAAAALQWPSSQRASAT
jgi:hypothetical protein